MHVNLRFVSLLILAFTFLCFWNVLPGEFLLDDNYTIVNQDLIKNFSSLPKLFINNYWGNHYPTGLYRPLTSLTYSFNYFLTGLNPWSYHLFNLLLHSLNGLMIYWLVKNYTQTNSLALFTAIIFTVHPVHTEAVSNVSGRPELLTACFALISWISYLSSKENHRYYWISLLFYFFSLLAKESGITLIGVLILVDLCSYWESWRSKLKQLIPLYFGYLILVFCYLLIRLLILKNLGIPKTWLYWRDIDLTTRLYTMSLGFIKYFKLLIWPINLAGDYDFSQIPKTSSLNFSVFISLLTIAFVFLLGCYFLKKERVIAFSILFFFITASSVSNILIPTGVLIAERLLYFPSISICLLFGSSLHFLYNSNKFKYLSIGIFSILIIFSIVVCYNRNIDWLNNKNFVESLVRVAPNNTKGIIGRASVYAKEGNIDFAEKEFKRAIEIEPNKATPKAALGNFYYSQNQMNKALPLLELALAIYPKEDPSQSIVYLNLARIHYTRKQYPEAINYFRRAIELSLPNPLLNQELAVIFSETGDLLNAQKELEKALIIKPDFAEAHQNLAIILNNLNKPQEALEHFHIALKFQPENTVTRNWYGKTLLGQGKFQEASDEFIKVIDLIKKTNSKDLSLAEIYNNLGVAYSQLQRYNEASKAFEKALEIAPNYANASKNLAILKENKN